jgi:hypothetical protein
MGISIFRGIKHMALLFLAGLIVFPVILLFFVMEDTALVSRHQRFSLDNVQRVRTLINANTPAKVNKRQISTITLPEKDLDLLLNYGILHGLGYERLFTEIELPDDRIRLSVTFDLPATPLGRYLNFFISLKKNGALMDIEGLKAGRLSVPAIFIHPALGAMNHVLSYSGLYADLTRHAHRIKDIAIEKGRLTLVYEWDPEALGLIHEKGKQLLLSRDHQEKLVLYYNKLVQTLTPYSHKKISLALVLRPMAIFARQQSAVSNNPILENTALVQVLSLYAVQRGLKDLVHEEIQKQMAPPVPVSFTLYGRTDLPKHFLVSAGLAVSAGSRFSNFIGIAKEVDDSGKGSGFGFADLAANKAGVRVGELAAGSLETALIFQERMGRIEQETDFMPRIDGLPEGIRQLEFQKRYTDLDSGAYTLVSAEIDKRINSCLVFR